MDRDPIRTCVGCRKQRPQDDLIRLSRRADGSVVVDTRHLAGGRGAYVCWNADCAAGAFDSGRLRKALRCAGPMEQSLRAKLLGVIETGREQLKGKGRAHG
jgi:predicted RNA-binding protein YlxR (DUF448 family)